MQAYKLPHIYKMKFDEMKRETYTIYKLLIEFLHGNKHTPWMISSCLQNMNKLESTGQ